MSETAPFYDALGEDYDRFVDWEQRLAFEMPFVRELLSRHSVRRVLDLACGTGMHAIALARQGYQVTAADISATMVRRAQANVQAAGVPVDVQHFGFGRIAEHLKEPLDAITCLGNSLPHLTTPESLHAALADMAGALRPGGILLLQSRNWDKVLARQERFMPPETHQVDSRHWAFLRFYDFEGETLRFNMVRLHREGEGPWRALVDSTTLRPWLAQELRQALNVAGLGEVAAYGSLRGDPYETESSGDLVLVAGRSTM
ncbi:MAG: class I SAM-dependent methyltransferase [Anaerolineae bacterium]